MMTSHQGDSEIRWRVGVLRPPTRPRLVLPNRSRPSSIGSSSEHLGVLLVVHQHLPRELGPLARHRVLGALDVTGLQLVEHADVHRAVLDVVRRGDGVAVVVHVLEQTAQVGGGDVGLQRPWRVGVAENPGQIGDVLHQQTLVGHLVVQLARLTVHGQFHSTEHLDVQTGCGDDDVGLQFPPGLQQDARLGEGVDLIGDDRRLAGCQHLEQITVRARRTAARPTACSSV